MGGCATKPNVLKEEGEAPKPVEDVSAAAVDDTSKDVPAGEESKEEAVDGRKSLGNFFSVNEAEENTATAGGEKPTEEKEDAKPEQSEEEEKATEASEVKADTAPADEEKPINNEI